MDAHDQGHGGDGLEPRPAGGDLGRVAAQLLGQRGIDRSERGQRGEPAAAWRSAARPGARRGSPGAGSGPARPRVARPARRAGPRPGCRGPRRGRSPLSRSAGSVDPIDAARRSAGVSYASSASATNAWSIATVDAPASRVTTSAQPASRGTPGNAVLLGQEGGQLEVGVEARLDPAIGLEQQPRRPARPTCSTGPAPAPVRRRTRPARGLDVPQRAEPRGRAAHEDGSPRHRTTVSSPAVIAAIVRPSAIAAASARQAPSPSAASRKPRRPRGP